MTSLASRMSRLARQGRPLRYAIDPQAFRAFMTLALRAHRLPTTAQAPELAGIPAGAEHLHGAMQGDEAALAQLHDLVAEHGQADHPLLPGLEAIRRLLGGRRSLPGDFLPGAKHLPAELSGLYGKRMGGPGSSSPQQHLARAFSQLVFQYMHGDIPGFPPPADTTLASGYAEARQPPWLQQGQQLHSALGHRGGGIPHLTDLHDLLGGLLQHPAVRGGQVTREGVTTPTLPAVERGHDATHHTINALLQHLLK